MAKQRRGRIGVRQAHITSRLPANLFDTGRAICGSGAGYISYPESANATRPCLASVISLVKVKLRRIQRFVQLSGSTSISVRLGNS